MKPIPAALWFCWHLGQMPFGAYSIHWCMVPCSPNGGLRPAMHSHVAQMCCFRKNDHSRNRQIRSIILLDVYRIPTGVLRCSQSWMVFNPSTSWVQPPIVTLGTQDNELQVLSPAALAEMALAFASAQVRALEQGLAQRLVEVVTNLNAKDLTSTWPKTSPNKQQDEM